MKTTQNQTAAQPDLAERIIEKQCPHGRVNTNYCWPTSEENEAVILRDRKQDAALIRPLIEAERSKDQRTIARLMEELERIAEAIPMDKTDANGFARDIRKIARDALAETAKEDKP